VIIKAFVTFGDEFLGRKKCDVGREEGIEKVRHGH
jgi:hypothetical protein